MFDENFTLEGLMETEVNVGDIFQIGSSKVIATQPRMPCYKLGIKFGCIDVIKKFLASAPPGWMKIPFSSANRMSGKR
jgi:MOSC domain-containing protein YiiM